ETLSAAFPVGKIHAAPRGSAVHGNAYYEDVYREHYHANKRKAAMKELPPDFEKLLAVSFFAGQPPPAPDVLSDVESDSGASVDSISGVVKCAWDSRRKHPRYMYPRDVAVGFSEPLRPTTWPSYVHWVWKKQKDRILGQLATEKAEITGSGVSTTKPSGSARAQKERGRSRTRRGRGKRGGSSSATGTTTDTGQQDGVLDSTTTSRS
ncbi:unnamed protein product, partial [Amoebophrya sp. A25]